MRRHIDIDVLLSLTINVNGRRESSMCVLCGDKDDIDQLKMQQDKIKRKKINETDLNIVDSFLCMCL